MSVVDIFCFIFSIPLTFAFMALESSKYTAFDESEQTTHRWEQHYNDEG